MTDNESFARKVIIAEDDHELSERLAETLRNQKYEVTVVTSALGVFRAISRQGFDLAIIDRFLPDQDGCVLTSYLRANTDMRILVLFEVSSVDDRLAAYTSGADFCLDKPLELPELLAIVASLFRLIISRKSKFSGEHKRLFSCTWLLITEEWLLVTPEGRRVHLTSKESTFLACLAEVTHCVVMREQLFMRLGYTSTSCGHRSLESLTYRLRKKISPSMDTPIKTSNGSGYSFLAPIRVIPEKNDRFLSENVRKMEE
jgi:DNA-binding response OmpR family regulator